MEKLYEEFVGDHRGNISSSITVLLVGKVQKSDAPQAVSRAEIDHWCELYQSAVRVVYLEYTVLYAQGSRDLLALLIEPYQSQYTTHCTKRKQAESPHRISNNGAHHFFHSTFDDGVRDDSEKVRKDEKKRNERQRKLEDMASQMRLMMESDQLEHENIEKQQREQEQQHQKHLLQQQQLQQQIAAKRAKRKPLVPLNTSSSSSQQPPGAPSNPPSNTSTPTSTMAAAMFGMMWLGSRSDDSETQPPPPPTVISSSHLQQQQQTMTLHQVQQKPLRRTTSAISAASGRSHNSTGRTHQAANGGDPHHSLHANRHSSDITSLIETMHSAVKAEESLLQRSLYMRDPYNYYDDEDEFEDVDEEIDACTEPGGTFAREESSDLDSSVFGNSRPASMNLTQQLGRRSISVNAALSLEARGLIVNPAYIEDGSPEADRDTPRGPEERPSMMGRQSSAVMSLMSESVRESVGSTTSNAHNNYQKPPLRANTSATGAGVNSASSRHVQKTPTTLPSVKEAPGGGSKSVDTSTELEEIGNYRKRRTTAGSFLMGYGCLSSKLSFWIHIV